MFITITNKNQITEYTESYAQSCEIKEYNQENISDLADVNNTG